MLWQASTEICLPWKVFYLKTAFFWKVTPCILVARYERVEGIHVPSIFEMTSTESEVLMCRYKIKGLSSLKMGFKFFSIRCFTISEKALLLECFQASPCCLSSKRDV
jgi:hypothetical protein